MLIVCIGVGVEWRQMANLAASRMALMTGLDYVVVSDLFYPACHPSWLKCHLLNRYKGEDLLIMDADIISLKMWNPQRIFEDTGRPFLAVPEPRYQSVLEECEVMGLPFPDIYVNGGLVVCGAHHAPIWQAAWKKHPKCGRWLEQSALNLAIIESDIPVCRLPRAFNYVTHHGKFTSQELEYQSVVNLHVSGCDSKEILEIYDKLGLDKTYPRQKDPDRIA